MHADVVYATFDKSCRREDFAAHDEQRRNKAKKGANADSHPLPFVVYSRLTEEGSTLSHCSRDMDSVTRALWTWEIIKVLVLFICPNIICVMFHQRGVSVVNSDPDVVFFRRMPPQCVTSPSLSVFM